MTQDQTGCQETGCPPLFLRLSLVMKLLGRGGHRGPTPCPAAEGGAQTGIICLWSPELTQKSLSPDRATPLAFVPVDLILGFSTIYILNASDTLRSLPNRKDKSPQLLHRTTSFIAPTQCCASITLGTLPWLPLAFHSLKPVKPQLG